MEFANPILISYRPVLYKKKSLYNSYTQKNHKIKRDRNLFRTSRLESMHSVYPLCLTVLVSVVCYSGLLSIYHSSHTITS
jgi:hypothetical protein